MNKIGKINKIIKLIKLISYGSISIDFGFGLIESSIILDIGLPNPNLLILLAVDLNIIAGKQLLLELNIPNLLSNDLNIPQAHINILRQLIIQILINGRLLII